MSESLGLLAKRDRHRLMFVTAIQMLTGLLDAIGVALFGFVAALATSAVSGQPLPGIVQILFNSNDVDPTGSISIAIWLSIIAGLLLMSKSVVNVLITRRVLGFLADRQAIVSGELAATLLSRPLLQLQQKKSQETSFALTIGVSAAILGVLGQAIIVVTELSLLGILSIGLLAVDPVVSLFAVAFFLTVALVLQRILSARGRQLGETNSEAEIASTASVQEALEAYREVLVAHRRNLYIDRFQALRWRAASVQADLNMMGLVPKYVFEIALVVGAGLLAWSQFYFKDAAAATATIVIFLAAASRIVPSMLRLQGGLLGIRVSSGMARPTIELAGELRQTGCASDEPISRIYSGAELARRIEFGHADFVSTVEVRDLAVTYDGGSSYALRDASLTVPSGTSLALVGPTGSGKSTLADAILGVIRPAMGHVLVGGVPPLEAVSLWPGGIAYVPQQVAMATGTIRQNVALGLPESVVDDARVWEALERAKLGDFLQATREGLDTIVGEAGAWLSGGQRQRLGIARALYTRPLLLVLDEATSALDAETERAIVDTLQSLEGEVTTITVAHRLATVRHCDLVAYLEGGRIVACGSFDKVVTSVPNFARQARLLGLD